MTKQVTNYRPISVLPVVSKVIETVIADQYKCIFHRKASVQLTDRLLDQSNQQKIPINFHLDLSKAFDGLNHNLG